MMPDRMEEVLAIIAKIRDNIVTEAESWDGKPYLYGGDSAQGIDCSHLFHRVYVKTVDSSLPYMSTSGLKTSAFFADVTDPKKGDMVLWDGHVAIVVDPLAGEFFGAQSSGVGTANYKTNDYWKKRAGLMFRQHLRIRE